LKGLNIEGNLLNNSADLLAVMAVQHLAGHAGLRNADGGEIG